MRVSNDFVFDLDSAYCWSQQDCRMINRHVWPMNLTQNKKKHGSGHEYQIVKHYTFAALSSLLHLTRAD